MNKNEIVKARRKIEKDHDERLTDACVHTGLPAIAIGFLSFFGPSMVAAYNTTSNPYNNTNIVQESTSLKNRQYNLRSQLAQEETLGLRDVSMFGLDTKKDYTKRDFLKNQLDEVETRLDRIEENPTYKSFVKWDSDHFTLYDGWKVLGYTFGLPTLSILSGWGAANIIAYRSKRRMDMELKQLETN